MGTNFKSTEGVVSSLTCTYSELGCGPGNQSWGQATRRARHAGPCNRLAPRSQHYGASLQGRCSALGRGLVFSAMTNCKVLRCTGEAAATLLPHPEHEAFKIPLCQAHDVAVKSGAQWLMDGDFGVPTGDGSTTGGGYTVRMGSDLPIVITSSNLSQTTGSSPGVLMTLCSDGPGIPSSTEFWIDSFQGQHLGEFFSGQPRTNP